MLRRALDTADRAYVALARRWHGPVATRRIGTLLIVAYVGALVLLELNRQGLLGDWAARNLPTSHFAAVDLAFTFLLVMEVVGIVFALAESVANSLAKQFELLALILLRKAFLLFSTFGEPIDFERVTPVLLEMTADAVGALLVFVLVGFFYRSQLHRKITTSEEEQTSFVQAKRLVALSLLVGFAALAVADLVAVTRGEAWPFFEAFYLILIFSDVLIVLISFRYSSSFTVLFRNSGFALSTVGARLALSAPAFLNAAIAVAAASFALLVSLTYNAFFEHIPHPSEEVGEAEGTRSLTEVVRKEVLEEPEHGETARGGEE
jgi:hypothetical protein